MFSGLRLFFGLRKFKKRSGRAIDISKLVPLFLKKGKDVSNYQYAAFLWYGKSGFGNRSNDTRYFYFDAPYRIILYCSKNKTLIPVGCLAFDVSITDISIRQIQGPTYQCQINKDDILTAQIAVKWERLLVRIVCEWARITRLKNVRMISCHQSRWYQDTRHDQMFMRYDVTARRMGFKFDSEEQHKGMYNLDISKPKLLEQAA